jgi:hypothetical protein
MADIIKMNTKKSESPPHYYSNVIEIVIGPYDFTISFGLKTPEQAKAKIKDFDRIANVSMSASQAKAAVVILKEMVDHYEKDFGEIPMENKFKQRYKKIFGG